MDEETIAFYFGAAIGIICTFFLLCGALILPLERQGKSGQDCFEDNTCREGLVCTTVPAHGSMCFDRDMSGFKKVERK